MKLIKKVFRKLRQEYEENFLTDREFVIRQHRRAHGLEPDLESPKTFNEKIQWRKLYEKNPLFEICADKVRVRDLVKEQIGEEYLIPVHQVVEKWEEIDFEALPNEFVIKTNHDSGTVFIVKDKNKTNFSRIRRRVNRMLRRDFGKMVKETYYSNIPPKIMIEKFMKTSEGRVPEDYKFYVFNNSRGIEVLAQIEVDRFGDHRRGIYTEDWKLLPVQRGLKLPEPDQKKPEKLDEMIRIAKKFGEKFTFVRVDLYEIDGKIYFGELTFCPASGITQFTPGEWDHKFGEMWEHTS